MPKLFDFFNKKTTPEIEVKLHILNKWLGDEVEKEFSIIYAQGNDLLSRIMKSSIAVKETAEDLANTEVKTGELSKHLIPTINNSKNSISIKTINSIEKLNFPLIRDFSTLSEISQTITQTLAQIDQTLKTHGKVIFTILNKEIRPLMSELKNIKKETAQLSKLVESNLSKSDKLQELKQKVSHIIDLQNDIKNINKIISEEKNNYDRVKEIKSKNEESIDRIRESNDYINIIKFKKEIEEVNLQLIKLRAEFDTLFSKLRKPLEKYSQIIQLKDYEKKILENYIETPSSGLITDNNLILEDFLKKMSTLVSNEKLKIKNPDKVLQRIIDLLPRLKKFQEKIIKLTNDYERTNNFLKNSQLKRLENMEKDLNQKKENIKELDLYINNKKKEREHYLDNFKKLLREFENNAKVILNKKIKVIEIDILEKK